MQPISVTPSSKLALLAAVVVADQLAFPVAQEVTRMLAGPAEAEVLTYSRGCAKRAGGVIPDVGTMGLLGPLHEHL